MKVNSYRDLIGWQKSMELTTIIYTLVKQLPKDEQFGLSLQMKRAVVSIPSNIAEGQSRHSTKEYIHFLTIARGSKSELETQLLICQNLQYLPNNIVLSTLELVEEVGRLINHYINELTQKIRGGSC